jgi:hypothetical protein
VLAEWNVDAEKTILGSEPFLAPIISGENREMVVSKLMELIKRL